MCHHYHPCQRVVQLAFNMHNKGFFFFFFFFGYFESGSPLMHLALFLRTTTTRRKRRLAIRCSATPSEVPGGSYFGTGHITVGLDQSDASFTLSQASHLSLASAL